MKRKFVYSILVGLTILTKLVASPIRSALGVGRGLQTAAEQWENPYITDGLIVMWDGEWNAGGGRHAPDVSVWVDVVSGCVVTFSIGPKADVAASGVWVLDNAYFIRGMSGTFVSDTVKAALNNRIFTIEYIIVPESGHEGCRYYIIQDSWRNGNGSWYWGLCGVRTVSPWTKVPIPDLVNYLMVTEDLGDRKCLLANGTYGQVYYSSVVQDTDIYYSSSLFKFCGDNTQWSYDFAFYGMIHSVRIYSRMLSEEELAYNYAIDKERFGLP